MEKYYSEIVSDIRTVKELAKVNIIKKVDIFLANEWKYDFYDIVRKELENNNRDFKIILQKLMSEDKFKRYAKDITRVLPKFLNKGMPDFIAKKDEKSILDESLDSIKREFNCEINVIEEKDSQEKKASFAQPFKPAILLE
jgi:hypothetical protein